MTSNYLKHLLDPSRIVFFGPASLPDVANVWEWTIAAPDPRPVLQRLPLIGTPALEHYLTLAAIDELPGSLEALKRYNETDSTIGMLSKWTTSIRNLRCFSLNELQRVAIACTENYLKIVSLDEVSFRDMTKRFLTEGA